MFMKGWAQTRLGDLDGAVETMQRAIVETELPPQRWNLFLRTNFPQKTYFGTNVLSIGTIMKVFCPGFV
jgi:hypothetical protein